MKNKRGFTLIEVLIVITIIGILVGIAGISGKAWLDRYRVESQTKVMFTDLMTARISAMQKKRMQFVTFSPSAANATQYTIYSDSTPTPDGDGALQPAADAVVTQTNLPTAYAVSSSAAEIDFNSNGLVTGVGTNTVRVIGSFGSAYDCIEISETKARMGKWNGANCDVQ